MALPYSIIYRAFAELDEQCKCFNIVSIVLQQSLCQATKMTISFFNNGNINIKRL